MTRQRNSLIENYPTNRGPLLVVGQRLNANAFSERSWPSPEQNKFRVSECPLLSVSNAFLFRVQEHVL